MATTSSQIPVPAPLRLAGNVAGDWKRFRGQWINYAKAVKLASEEADCQAAVFLACIGPDAYELFETFEFASDEDRSDLTKIMDAFEAHCVGVVNVVRTIRILPALSGEWRIVRYVSVGCTSAD